MKKFVFATLKDIVSSFKKYIIKKKKKMDIL